MSQDDDRARRAAERLRRPDGIVFRSDAAISDFIKPYTVALVGPEGPGLGSGLLVQLWGRYFLLTAGHVVRRVDAINDSIRLVIAHAIHDARFRLEKRRYVCGTDQDDADFGYFEIPAYDAERIRAHEKVFAGPGRLQVQPTAEDDLYVVSGYPAHRAINGSPTGQTWVQFHHWTTAAAGYRSVPAAPRSMRAGMRVINLSVDPSAIILDYTGPDEAGAIKLKEAIDPMSGASGGPCWRTFAPRTVGEWEAKGLKAVACHRARSVEVVDADGTRYRFAREVSIGHHLRTIADDYPDLRAIMMQSWPILEQYPNADGFDSKAV